MVSTYTPNIGAEIPAYGEKSNTWGTVVETVFKTLERAATGTTDLAIAGATTTLTATDGALNDWHYQAFRLTGTLGANSTLNFPTRRKTYIVTNDTTGAFTMTVKVTGGTGVTVPQGTTALLVSNGTNMTGVVLQPYNSNLTTLAGSNGTLTAYRETRVAGSASGTTILDLSSANIFDMTQAVNITTLTFANAPASGSAYSFTLIRRKDATATARTIAWPASVKWPGAVAPILTQTTGAVDVFSFLTVDGGTTWLGFISGLDIR
jgi:hypothetical protein